MAKENFDATALPTAEQLQSATALSVQDASGNAVQFSTIIAGEGKIIVLFIRHFGCGLCQDMVSFVSHKLPPSLLSEHNARLVIVGNGASALIKPYKDLLDCPYEIYTDPERKVYAALGMTIRTFDAGKFDKLPEYLQGGMFSNVLRSMGNMLKMGKPLSSGDLKALGGEFVFGPGPETIWCHRMENTRGHATVAEIAQAAGVPAPA